MSSKRKQGEEDSASDVSLVDIDFDFFDPNPAVDSLTIKRLLKQLFQDDSELFFPHSLAELILSQPTIGTTIKTDGIDGDPYALLTVLNMHVHCRHPSVMAITNYALQKTSEVNPAFHTALKDLFSAPESHIGLVISERLLNMPIEVVPPMYVMLSDEIKLAIDDNEPYRFSHFLFVSRTYYLSAEEESFYLDAAHSKFSSKRKRPNTDMNVSSAGRSAGGLHPFHAEDEYIHDMSIHSVDYFFSSNPHEPRELDAFGIDTRGRMMLFAADRFPELVQKLQNTYSN